MELLAARATGDAQGPGEVRARIRGYALRAPRLFPAGADSLPAAPCALVPDFRPQPECREISEPAPRSASGFRRAMPHRLFSARPPACHICDDSSAGRWPGP